MRHPESDLLGRIRDLIAAQPQRWRDARDDRDFNAHWQLVGDRLTRKEVTGARLAELSAAHFATAKPFIRFLCEAAGVRY